MQVWELDTDNNKAGSRQLNHMLATVWGTVAVIMLLTLILTLIIVSLDLNLSKSAVGWTITAVMMAAVVFVTWVVHLQTAKNHMIDYKFVSDLDGRLWITDYKLRGFRKLYSQMRKSGNEQVNFLSKAAALLTGEIGGVGIMPEYIKDVEVINYFEAHRSIRVMADYFPVYFYCYYIIEKEQVPAIAWRIDKILKVREKGSSVKIKFRSYGKTRTIWYSTNIANYHQLYDLLIGFNNCRKT